MNTEKMTVSSQVILQSCTKSAFSSLSNNTINTIFMNLFPKHDERNSHFVLLHISTKYGCTHIISKCVL